MISRGKTRVMAKAMLLSIFVLSCATKSDFDVPPMEFYFEPTEPCILADLVSKNVDMEVKQEATEAIIESLDEICGAPTIHGRKMERILKKKGMTHPSACKSNVCIAKVGSDLGAWKVLTGFLSFEEGLFKLKMQMFDVKNAKIEEEMTLTTEHPEDVKFIARIVMFKIFGFHDMDPDLGE